MSLSLNRSDLIQVGATNNNCLTLIKEAAFHLEKGEQNDDEDIVIDNKSKEEKRKKDEKKKDEKNKRNKLLVTDKVVIGSQDGTLTVIEKKKNSIAILSKSLPGPPITSVKLGGTTATHDRIFFSADNFIRGFFKKGKQFFGFETNFTDAIQCMFIYGLELLVSSNNVLTHYHDTQEVNSYICGEPITDIICLPKKEGSWVGGRQLTPVIACEDKKIKVLCAGQLIYLIKINDVPTILRLYMNDGGYNKEKVLYGTRNGTIGLLWLPENDYTLLWEINTTSTSQITSFCFYNLFGGSYPDLILGKDDGMIEMYTLDADTINLRQLYATNETITGIVCGRVNNQNYDEIIVSTYTGWIFSLSTEPVAGETGGNLPHVPQMDIRIEELEKEVKILEESVVEHRQKFEFANPADDESDIYAYELEVNDKLILNNELASYTFTIELIIPIEFYVIQTTLDLMLIDVDKNQSILSITEPERFPEEGNKLVAFYRCQPNTKKIQFCVNTFEGCHGDIKVYIAPSRIPRTIQLRTYNIRPLALHKKVHDFDETRPCNVLKVEGNFAIADAHSWIRKCLGDNVMEKLPPMDEVTYGRGHAKFESDNLSTIAILRDVISDELSNKELKANIHVDIDDSSIYHTLKLLDPKLEYSMKLTYKLEMTKALKEVTSTFADTSYLSEEEMGILKDYDKLHKDFEEHALNHDKWMGVVCDLYHDKHKMKGQYSKHKHLELLTLMKENYSLENVYEFFNTKLN